MLRSIPLPSLLLLCTIPAVAEVAVLTYHNDNFRTGQNLKETTLTSASMGSFGKMFSRVVDGQVYAQPLHAPNVPIKGQGKHNVVFVATENDTVYAFDADSNTGANPAPLWQAAFADPANGVTPVTAAELGCSNTSPLVGIAGTPVIDRDTGTLYVVVKTREATGGTVHYFQRLHALSISSGAEKQGGPFEIHAAATGTCKPNVNGRVIFSPPHQVQRAGLALHHGVLYAAFASHCDIDPYTGWILAIGAKTGKLLDAFDDAPDQGPLSNKCRAGIWQAGAAPAIDTSGDLSFATGNGYFDGSTAGGRDYGDSHIKLTLPKMGFAVADCFTPYNQATLDGGDIDLGSGGVLLLPDQPGPNPHLMVQVGKEGTIYLTSGSRSGDPPVVMMAAGLPGSSNGR